MSSVLGFSVLMVYSELLYSSFLSYITNMQIFVVICPLAYFTCLNLSTLYYKKKTVLWLFSASSFVACHVHASIF